MSKPLTIMFDIDGVLADFIYGITSLASNYFRVSPITSDRIESWTLPFLHQDQLDRLWESINNSPRFWADLPLAPSVTPEDLGRIVKLNDKHKVYFVTSRPEGNHTMQQTRDWLRWNGIDEPNVILTKRKGEFARLVEADYSIEDKWENAHCIHWLSDSPQTKSYLIDRPYNQLENEKVGASGVRRVKSVSEFLDEVARGK